MTGFYNITTKLKQALETNEITSSVTEGDLFSLDISKQSIFPLAHLAIGNVTHNGPVLNYAVTIVFADVVDISKEEDADAFVGNDDEHDVLNTQLAAGVRLVELARRGELFDDGIQLEGSPSFEPFTERFENYLAGWVLTMTISQRNTMTIC
jgi:hypothetical protein